MTLVRWDPFRDVFTLQDRMNRFFSDALFRNTAEGTTADWLPVVDIYEQGDSLVVQAELPGLRKDDVSVQVENSVLTLQGERRQEKSVKSEQYHRLERSFGRFTRSFSLPSGIDTKNIRAEFRDGILKVTLPKAEEAKPKKIEVLAA